MRRFLLKRLLPLVLLCAALLALLALSDNSRMEPAQPEEKPYYVQDRAVVAELGGLGLTFAEFRYHAWQALTQDLGKRLGEVDLFYDEALAEQVRELALLRAARWRAVTVLAMEAGVTAPEPEADMVEALCREPFVTSSVAASYLRSEALSSLVFLEKYGPEGSLLSPDSILDWGAENGIVRIRVDDLCAAYGEDERWAAGKQLAPDCPEEALYAAAAKLAPGDCAALRLEDGVYLLLRTALAPEEGVRTGEGTESLRSLAARGLARRELGETAGSLERVFRPEWKRIRMDLLFRQDLN